MNWIVPILLVAGFLLFFAPVTAGIVNLGNAVGMGFFALLTVIYFFRKSLAPLMRIAPVRISVIAVTSVAAVLLMLALIISVYMCVCAAAKPSGSSAAVIVLGCRVKGERPSRMLMGRINAARKYLEDNQQAYCILSGGQGGDELISEAECMYRELVNAGISPDRLIKEDRSTDTDENIVNSAAYISKLAAQGKVSAGEAVIITNEYHQCRAKLIAQKHGLSVKAVSAHSTIGLLPTYWVRECFGVAYEIAF